MGMRRALGILITATLIASVYVLPATADVRRVADDNDTKGPLDIAWVKHGHRTNAKGMRQLVHTVRLYERWPVRRLKHRGFIHLFFDLKGNPNWREEREVVISYEDGRLRAQLIDFAADPPTFMRMVPMWRPNGRTIKVAFRKLALRRRSFSFYRWNALSFIEERHSLCGRSGGCSDWVPRRDYIRHDL